MVIPTPRKTKVYPSIYSDESEMFHDGNNGNKYYSLRMGPEERIKFKVYVKRRLKKKHMTIKDLAAEINRPLRTVYNTLMLSDKNLRGAVCAEIANYFKISRADWYDVKPTEEELTPGHQHLHVEHTNKYKSVKKYRDKKHQKEGWTPPEPKTQRRRPGECMSEKYEGKIKVDIKKSNLFSFQNLPDLPRTQKGIYKM